jgi:hypothetical protein
VSLQHALDDRQASPLTTISVLNRRSRYPLRVASWYLTISCSMPRPLLYLPWLNTPLSTSIASLPGNKKSNLHFLFGAKGTSRSKGILMPSNCGLVTHKIAVAAPCETFLSRRSYAASCRMLASGWIINVIRNDRWCRIFRVVRIHKACVSLPSPNTWFYNLRTTPSSQISNNPPSSSGHS